MTENFSGASGVTRVPDAQVYIGRHVFAEMGNGWGARNHFKMENLTTDLELANYCTCCGSSNICGGNCRNLCFTLELSQRIFLSPPVNMYVHLAVSVKTETQ